MTARLSSVFGLPLTGLCLLLILLAVTSITAPG